jgi:hypothetical protein
MAHFHIPVLAHFPGLPGRYSGMIHRTNRKEKERQNRRLHIMFLSASDSPIFWGGRRDGTGSSVGALFCVFDNLLGRRQFAFLSVPWNEQNTSVCHPGKKWKLFSFKFSELRGQQNGQTRI